MVAKIGFDTAENEPGKLPLDPSPDRSVLNSRIVAKLPKPRRRTIYSPPTRNLKPEEGMLLLPIPRVTQRPERRCEGSEGLGWVGGWGLGWGLGCGLGSATCVDQYLVDKV